MNFMATCMELMRESQHEACQPCDRPCVVKLGPHLLLRVTVFGTHNKSCRPLAQVLHMAILVVPLQGIECLRQCWVCQLCVVAGKCGHQGGGDGRAARRIQISCLSGRHNTAWPERAASHLGLS